MNKILLYGGTFNPPTCAHDAILNASIDYANKIGAEVWLLPSGNRNDKTIENLSIDRLALLNVFIRDRPVRIETYEYCNSRLTETSDTKKYLAKKYPTAEFIWIFGSDSVNTMHDWQGGSELWDNEKMLIIQRPGYALLDTPPKAAIIDVPMIKTSSTEVRQRLQTSRSISGLVTKEVERYLMSAWLCP